MTYFGAVHSIQGAGYDEEHGDSRAGGQDCLDSRAVQRTSSNGVLEQDGEVSKVRLYKSGGLAKLSSSSSLLCTACFNVQSEGTLTSHSSAISQQPLDVTPILQASQPLPNRGQYELREIIKNIHKTLFSCYNEDRAQRREANGPDSCFRVCHL